MVGGMPRAPKGWGNSSGSRRRRRRSLRELGPVSTHDVLCSWRGVGVETKGREHRFWKRICEKFAELRV